MKEVKLNKKLLNEFLLNLRYEDRLELQAILTDSFEKELFEILKDKNNYFYFLVTNNNKPLALGGAKPTINKKIAKVWMLCTTELDNCKVEFYKYVKNKINFFKTKFDVLYNFIYKSNFSSLKWLKKSGFKDYVLQCSDYKLFYYIKGGMEFDLRYFACE